MSLFNTNLASLRAKFQHLLLEITHLDPTIIALTETWLDEDIEDISVAIPGYTIYRKDRPGKNTHGGVAMYVKDDLQGTPIVVTVLDHLVQLEMEGMWLKIRIGEVSFIVASIYRPPHPATAASIPSDLVLFDVLRRTTQGNDALIILGDFNLPSLTWTDGLPSSGKGELEEDFEDALNDTNLTQLITEPTRFCAGDRPSLLDLFLTNEPDLVTGYRRSLRRSFRASIL